MTNQEAIERVSEHLVKQGEQCSDIDGCLYRREEPGGTFTRCAFGIFVPDELYLEEMEGAAIYRVMKLDKTGQIRKTLGSVSVILLKDMQTAHDDSSGGPKKWLKEVKLRLRDVADLHKLKTPACLLQD